MRPIISEEHKSPNDFISPSDIASAPNNHSSPYTVESMKKHHDAVVYYKQRRGEDWFHGRVSKKYCQNYDKIKWN